MQETELKEYIYNYIKNDKTKSAIMLDGEWGIGKSYFIQNSLAPYIREKKIINVLLFHYME